MKHSTDFIKLKGTPVDVAYSLGKKRSKNIVKRIAVWNTMLDDLYKGRRAEQKKLEKLFLQEAKKQAPAYLDELYAMAQGAGVPFTELFRLNLTELNAFAEKCTTLFFKVYQKNKNSILFAHNEDWNPKRNDVFVLEAHLPDMSYLILTYDGYLPGLSCGFNSHGVYHAVNYLRPLDMRAGLPRIFITRHLVTARDINTTLDWIGSKHRAFGQSIHLAKNDRYINLEITASKMTVRKPKLPTAHANHFLAKNLLKDAAKKSASSHMRQKRAGDLLKEFSQKTVRPNLKQAITAAKKILSDTACTPTPIWIAEKTGEPGSATIATALFATNSNALTVYRQQPVKNRCQHFILIRRASAS